MKKFISLLLLVPAYTYADTIEFVELLDVGNTYTFNEPGSGAIGEIRAFDNASLNTYSAALNGSFCFGAANCTGRGEIALFTPVTNLSFAVIGTGQSNPILAQVFFEGTRLSQAFLTANYTASSGLFSDFSIFPQIDLIRFLNTSNASLVVYGNFQFDLVTQTQIPEPGTLALFATGLLGMGLARRKRKV